MSFANLFRRIREALEARSERKGLIPDCETGLHSFGPWSRGIQYQWRYCRYCGLGECRTINTLE